MSRQCKRGGSIRDCLVVWIARACTVGHTIIFNQKRCSVSSIPRNKCNKECIESTTSGIASGR